MIDLYRLYEEKTNEAVIKISFNTRVDLKKTQLCK